MTLISLVFLASILATVYANSKWELDSASKLYASKIQKDLSYWMSYKLSDALNPRNSSFFLWKVAGYGPEGSQRVSSEKAKSVPVLAYHGLPNEGIGQIPNDIFVEQMKTLKNNGWNTISLEEFSRFLKGEEDLPDKSFLITFDDGRKDTFYPADPVLRDLGFEAVIFVITKRSISGQSEDSSYYLSSYELREMEKTGRWDAQSHGRDSHDWYYIDDSNTLGHYYSDRFWLSEENRLETDEEYRGRIRYDLSASKKDLENKLGGEITAIAFPFGDYGQDALQYEESVDVVKSEASKLYDLAFYQVRKGVGETHNYPEGQFMAKRIEPMSDWSGEHLLAVLESGASKSLPYSSETFGIEWRSHWGQFQAGENLTLESAQNSAGASATLNGSYLWKNYLFTADVNWIKGGSVVLIARQNPDGDYYGCNFGPNSISIKKYSDKVSQNLVKNDYTWGGYPRNFSLGVEASGTDISCLVNGEKIVTGSGVNQTIPNGGIGVEIWDEKTGNASAGFDNIKVTGY